MKVLVDEGKVVWSTLEEIEEQYKAKTGWTPPSTSTPEPPQSNMATGQVYIVIHADPHGDEVCEAGGDSQWDKLVGVMASAESHDHKITLLMSADWADCLQGDDARFDVLKGWVQSGHQIGYHHHDCSHATPDGYRADGVENCNTPPCSTCKGTLKGTAAESFAKVKAIETRLINEGVDPKKAVINTANMGPNKWCATNGQCFRQHEWDEALIYGTEQVSSNPVRPDASYRFLTAPNCRNYSDGVNEIQVVEMGHAQINVAGFATSHAENNIEAIEAARTHK